MSYSSRSYTGKTVRPIIIIGQSNAVGQGVLFDADNSRGHGVYLDPEGREEGIFMYGNDGRYKAAYEPVDDGTKQEDTISKDGVSYGEDNLAHSSWLRAANYTAKNSNNKSLLLVPCPKGSTVYWLETPTNTSWNFSPKDISRDSLFGNANYRKKVTCREAPPAAIWGWGHETSTETNWSTEDVFGWNGIDTESRHRTDFRRYLNAFWDEWGTNVPIIWVQLGPSSQGTNTNPTTIDSEAETWYRMSLAKTEQFLLFNELINEGKPFYLVPSFIFGTTDGVHVWRSGVDSVGEHVALATRHALGESSLAWSGPLPLACTADSTTQTRITFNATINSAVSNYDSQFFAFDDDGTFLAVSAVANDGGDILVTHAAASGNVTITYGYSFRANTDLANHLRESTTGLPTPAFRITVGETYTWPSRVVTS